MTFCANNPLSWAAMQTCHHKCPKKILPGDPMLIMYQSNMYVITKIV